MRSHLRACHNCRPEPCFVEPAGLYSIHYFLCPRCMVNARVVITFDGQFLYEVPKDHLRNWNILN